MTGLLLFGQRHRKDTEGVWPFRGSNGEKWRYQVAILRLMSKCALSGCPLPSLRRAKERQTRQTNLNLSWGPATFYS